MTHKEIKDESKRVVFEAMQQIDERGIVKLTVPCIKMRMAATGNRRSESCINAMMRVLESEGKIKKVGKIKELGNPVEWEIVEEEELE
jgi:hypothetical protein